MRKIVLLVMAVILFSGADLYAQGDLFVIGDLGVGTDSPAMKFHLVGPRGQFYSSGEQFSLQRSTDTSPITGFLFEIYKSRGSVGSETNVNSNDVIGQYDFFYHNSGATLGARWGAQMDNSTSATKFWFGVANRAQFQMDVDVEGGLKVDNGSVTCIMLRDTDDAGWTECNALNGSLTCSVDADGVCDGS